MKKDNLNFINNIYSTEKSIIKRKEGYEYKMLEDYYKKINKVYLDPYLYSNMIENIYNPKYTLSTWD